MRGPASSTSSAASAGLPEGAALTVFQHPLPVVARRRRAWRVGVAAAIVAVYVAGLSPQVVIKGDSSLYLSLARSLAGGDGYTVAGRPHTDFPPAYPVMLAGLMRLGAGSFLALNIAMLAGGLLAAGACYLLLRELMDPDWALLLTAVVALSVEMYEHSGRIMADVPFVMFVYAGLWLYARGLRRPARRGGWELGSAMLLASCLVRPPGVFIAVSAAVGLVLSAWRSARRRALLNAAVVIVGVAVMAAAVSRLQQAYQDPDSFSYTSSVQRWTTGHTPVSWFGRTAGNFYVGTRHFCRLLTAQRMPALLCIVLLVLPVFVGMVRRVRAGEWLVATTVAGYVAGISLLGVRSRYYLPLLPLLLLLLLEGYAWALAKVKLRRPKLSVGAAVAILMGVLVGANLPLIGRDIYRKRRPDFATAQQDGQYRDLPAVAACIAGRPPRRGEVILSSQPVAVLADLPVLSASGILLSASPSAEEMILLFRRLRVRYVVLSREREPNALFRTLKAHLAGSYAPVFTGDLVLVYEIDERGVPASRPASAPAGP